MCSTFRVASSSLLLRVHTFLFSISPLLFLCVLQTELTFGLEFFVLGKRIQAGLIIYHEVNTKFKASARKTYYFGATSLHKSQCCSITFSFSLLRSCHNKETQIEANVCKSESHCQFVAFVMCSSVDSPSYNVPRKANK